MTKQKPEIVTLLILGIISLLLGLFLLFNAPVHNAPFEHPGSYEALRAAFADSDNVFLPEDDGTIFEGSELFLVGRTLFAKPERYIMQRMEHINDTAVYYDVECDWSSISRIIGEPTYRGVRYQLTTNTDKKAYSHVSVYLILGKMAYYLSAHYTSDKLDEAQMQSINEKAAERLEIYTKQIIDQYLQRSGS